MASEAKRTREGQQDEVKEGDAVSPVRPVDASPSPVEEPVGAFAAFHSRPFLLFWLTICLSLTGVNVPGTR